MSPPYAPQTAALGGVPTVGVDVPICAVFLALFITGAVSHMTILQVNRRRSHKFIISGMMFGFCMARITTMVMRITWACRPNSVPIAIASQVFTAAGVVLLFVINVLFAQRILRAQHPNAGWHPIIHYGFIAIYVLIVITLIMIITTVVQQFYTLDANTHRIDRDIILYGGTFYAFISFLPIPLVLISLIIPRKTHVQKFGEGRFRNKIIILLLAATLLCLGATYRVGTNFKNPRPRTDPPGYFSKACFYIFNFVVEIIVILLYVIVRVDRRFWIPNGSHASGDYLKAQSGPELVEKLANKNTDHPDDHRIIGTEEEVFDDEPPSMARGGDVKAERIAAAAKSSSGTNTQDVDVERGHERGGGHSGGGLGGTTAVPTPMTLASPPNETEKTTTT